MRHDYIETHLEKHEYIEGPEALENFKRLARTVFRAKKTSVQAQPKKAATKAVRRRPSGKDKA